MTRELRKDSRKYRTRKQALEASLRRRIAEQRTQELIAYWAVAQALVPDQVRMAA